MGIPEQGIAESDSINTGGEDMAELSDYRKAGQELLSQLRLATFPVALKYIQDISEIPAKAIKPSQSGQKWSLCQAITYARR